MTAPGTWLAVPTADPHAPVRLLCLPAAGGGSAAYRGWAAVLAGVAEVAVLALPGRDARLGDAPLRRVADVVTAAADGIADWWDDDPRPVAVFGHSMGALLGYELLRERRRRGAVGACLLVASARRAPQLPYDPARHRLHELSRADLVTHLRGRGGTPDEVLDDPEVFEVFEPTLRADLELVECYVHTPDAPLEVPVLTFRGEVDAGVPADEVAAWEAVTTGGTRHVVFPGGHFFHTTHPDAVRRLGVELAGTRLAAAV